MSALPRSAAVIGALTILALLMSPGAQAQQSPAARPTAPVPDSKDYVQQAAACMNERKSVAPVTAIKSCDAVIDEIIRNLANAYYFRGGATMAQRDYDGAIDELHPGPPARSDPRRISRQPRRSL